MHWSDAGRPRRGSIAWALLIPFLAAAGCADGEALLDRIARANELDLGWSYAPSARRLAFARNVGEPGLFVMDVRDPSSLRRLDREPRWSRHGEPPWPRHPSLSPDGRWLAFHDLRREDHSWDHRLYLMSLDDQAGPRLIVDGDPGRRVGRTAFSPDGGQLVYEHGIRGAARGGDELRLFDRASGADRSLVVGLPAKAPVWAPDGGAVYFMSDICLRRVRVLDGSVETLACVEGAQPLRGPADEPALSPDGETIAITVEDDDCPRVILVDSKRRSWRALDSQECGLHPAWISAGELAYVAGTVDGSRALRSRSIRSAGPVVDEPGSAAAQAEGARSVDGAPRSLGAELGVSYGLRSDGEGALLALMADPRRPRAIWRVESAGRRTQVVAVDPPEVLASLAAEASVPFAKRLRSADGLSVPLWVFPPSARRKADRGPAILYLHGGTGGREDVSPRWSEEIAYLSAAGYTVVAVNFRGSTGYGVPYRERSVDDAGKVEDARAGLRYLRTLPWVDPARVFVFGVCTGGAVGAALVRAEASGVRGAVQWLQSAWAWAPGAARDAPPLLWVSGAREPGAEAYPEIAAKLARAGLRLERVEVPDGHILLEAENRARGLRAVRRFIDAAR